MRLEDIILYGYAAFLAFIPTTITVIVAVAASLIASNRLGLPFRLLAVTNIVAGFVAAFVYNLVTPASFHRSIYKIVESDSILQQVRFALPPAAWVATILATIAIVTVVVVLNSREEEPADNE